MVIFHSYVSLPEGKRYNYGCIAHLLVDMQPQVAAMENHPLELLMSPG